MSAFGAPLSKSIGKTRQTEKCKLADVDSDSPLFVDTLGDQGRLNFQTGSLDYQLALVDGWKIAGYRAGHPIRIPSAYQSRTGLAWYPALLALVRYPRSARSGSWACEAFKGISRKLYDKPNSIEELSEQREWMKTIPEALKTHEEAINKAMTDYELIEEFYYNLSQDDFNAKWTAIGWPHKIVDQMDMTLQQLEEDEERFRKIQLSDQNNFQDRLDTLQMVVAGFAAHTDISKAHEIANELKESQELAQTYNNRERLFEMPVTDYQKLSKMVRDFEPYRNLWLTTSDWLKWHESWMTDPLTTIDAEALETQVNNSYKTMHKCVKLFKDVPGPEPNALPLRHTTPGCQLVATEMRTGIKEFRPYIPLIQGLRNPGMRNRHWEQLSSELGFPVRPKASLTFSKCLDMKLQDHIEVIAKVAEVAGKEYSIEQALDKMEAEWDPIKFEIIPYKETGTYILRSSDESSQLLDDHIVMTQSMSFSPYKKPFEERITTWESKLKMTQDVLDEWLLCQRSWLYLEPIFSSEDINRQLPVKGKRFQTMDRMWRKIMKNANDNPQVISLCPDARLLENLKECNKLLEQVQKGLSEYLETKRSAFPRFYFLSDDELLEILSQTKDPKAVQPHLRKCFENMAKLHFEEDLAITKMFSMEGECVPMSEKLYPTGNVEDWLLEVERVMRESLRTIIGRSLAVYPDTKRTEWVLDWPGQIVIAGCQTFWSKEVSDSLEEGKLPERLDILIDQLAGLVGLVRGKLSKMQREILSALIVIEVHARDVVANMVELEVKNVNDFEWINNLYVRAVNAEFPYGYEYLGNTGRLVITPLTDRDCPESTMNPGYAGRTELPDNLKALFRPVAMMVPDYAMIAEISLYSFGFSDAKVLAKKITTTFKLSSEQLSSQDHYDFGMRAVKTVISAAGNLKREHPDMNEELICLRAIRDVNVPKFLVEDLKLFTGIVSDLFPKIKEEPIDYGTLDSSLVASCEKLGIKDVRGSLGFITKCIQLYETTVVRHGLMLVGPTCSGKTMCYKTLQAAMTALKGEPAVGGGVYEAVHVNVVNPKSITMGQLYGEFDLLTHEWTDGILSTLVREGTAATDSDKRWYMFDGPVDAVWIENMNTVLDDNKKLCLSSGEIIKLTEHMTMMFEKSIQTYIYTPTHVVSRLDTTKLKQEETSVELANDLNRKLKDLRMGESSVEDDWSTLKKTVYSTALEHLGSTKRKNQDWFDENDPQISSLLAQKHHLHRLAMNDPASIAKKTAFTNIRREVQNRLRQMQDDWLSKKADEIQAYADMKDSKRFYDGIRALYGPQASSSSPLLSADGATLITDRAKILDRWAEHFEAVLNRPSNINNAAIERLPQIPVNQELDILPSLSETQKAISQMSNGKAPGLDGIPAKVYKSGGHVLTQKLTDIFCAMWEKGTIPQDFKDASIVHIYKRKGNRQSCDNHRGISLLCIAGKILARILLNRLIKHLEQGHLPESQCGFRAGRGTVDMIFAARQLQEKCQEQHKDLYTTFIDLTKAFDLVSREGLWKIMAKFGCPERFTSMIRQFHEGMTARVQDDGETSTAFPVTNGVKQGCVLAPTLVSIVFTAMLTDAFHGTKEGIDIKYRTDGKLLNQRRLLALTKVKHTVLKDFLFADDCALNATSGQDMQISTDRFSGACDNFGLVISTKKTEVLYQPRPGKPYKEPCVTVHGQVLNPVDKFTYLGSTMSRQANIDEEVNGRISKASSAFGRLRRNVWDRRGIKLSTKLKVYQAVQDLAVASPATVSRCGMVYLEPQSLGIMPFVECWLKKLPACIVPHEEKLQSLFNSFLEDAIKFKSDNMKEYVPSVDGNLAFSLMRLLECFFHPFIPKEGEPPVPEEKLMRIEELIEPWFVFSLIWSVGGTCNNDGRVRFSQWVRERMVKENIALQFPSENLVYDYRLDDAGLSKKQSKDDVTEEDEGGEVKQIRWTSWMDSLPEVNISLETRYSDIIVPTMDTIRGAAITELLLTNHKKVLCVGPTGTGKSLTIQDKLSRGMPPEFLSDFIAFSAQTSANQTQDLINSKLDKRRKGVFGPPLGKTFIIFIDDMNMPALEVYGAQPPIELIRQYMDHGGWYDHKMIGAFHNLVDITFIAAIGPPGGGRNPITPRLLRHFNFLTFTEMEDFSKRRIFATILGAWMQGVPVEKDVNGKLVDATIEMYNTITTQLLPTPAKSHYTFNLRDLSKVFQGVLMVEPGKVENMEALLHFWQQYPSCVLMVEPGKVENMEALLRLWYHESCRVFKDRLVDDTDREWFDDLSKEKMQKLGVPFEEAVPQLPVLFGDFMQPNSDNKLYNYISDIPKMVQIMVDYLDDYNQINTARMRLVLFMDAVKHVCRISRIIRQPLGNALLLGVGGSGRQSLTRLATHMAEYDAFQIELSKNYGNTEWREDLKSIMLKAGLESKPMVFIFPDTQIKSESFLEDINNILNSGDVPNIYAQDELDNIYTSMKPIVQDAGIAPTKTNLYQAYTKRVRSNTHMVLCMSPIGEVFRARLRQFPSLVNCCTIDWFSEWPADALTSVANTFLQEIPDIDSTDQDLMDGLVKMCMAMQLTVAKKSTQYLAELSRHNYVTPTSYLELLGIFSRLLGMKKTELNTARNRMKTGLDKNTPLSVKMVATVDLWRV
ncbi:Dynein heavy chain 1, axonemal [Branchiostoma belcheri]|nr:Dynein heavy chain 1, axonemal [Branchiostoma belcheri]